MTPEDRTEMTLPEIDRFLAERLMGWIWSDEHEMWCVDSERDTDGRLTFACPDELDWINDDPDDLGAQEVWSPTTNPAQALGDGGEGTVVGRMKRLDWEIELMSCNGKWEAKFCHYLTGADSVPNRIEYAEAFTPSEAISRAAVEGLRTI